MARVLVLAFGLAEGSAWAANDGGPWLKLTPGAYVGALSKELAGMEREACDAENSKRRPDARLGACTIYRQQLVQLEGLQLDGDVIVDTSKQEGGVVDVVSLSGKTPVKRGDMAGVAAVYGKCERIGDRLEKRWGNKRVVVMKTRPDEMEAVVTYASKEEKVRAMLVCGNVAGEDAWRISVLVRRQGPERVRAPRIEDGGASRSR